MVLQLLDLVSKVLNLIFPDWNQIRFIPHVLKVLNRNPIPDKSLSMVMTLASSDNKTSLHHLDLGVRHLSNVVNWHVWEILTHSLEYPTEILCYIATFSIVAENNLQKSVDLVI